MGQCHQQSRTTRILPPPHPPLRALVALLRNTTEEEEEEGGLELGQMRLTAACRRWRDREESEGEEWKFGLGRGKIVSRLRYLCASALAPTLTGFPFPESAFVSIEDGTEEGEQPF